MPFKTLAPPGRRRAAAAVHDEHLASDPVAGAHLAPRDDLDFAPAVLDAAHIGDIEGSLGTISMHDRSPRRGWWPRLVTLAAIMGPGLIVMTGDNDAGGVQTYTQAGQVYGTSLLWVLVGLFVVLFVAQEMVTRLGAVTGVGHARLIKERFGRFWNLFSVGDLFLLNFLTLLTEFIGVRFAMAYFGVPKSVSVPAAAVMLFGFAATGRFRRWERFMLLMVLASLVVIPCLLLAHPSAGPILHGLVPGVQGGVTGSAILVIVAVVGTTVAPWQLFFQQSNIVDKRITPRWLNYERTETLLGAILTTLAAGAMIAFAAFALNHTKAFGPAAAYLDSGWFNDAIRTTIGPAAGALAAIMLLVAAVLGAGAVSLSTSYAFGDTFNKKHSLHRSLRSAPLFYGAYGAQIVLACAVVLVGSDHLLGTLTQYVQVLAGILLPSAILFLVLLCNDTEVLGPWVNNTWQNVIAYTIIAVLVVLSMILVISTLFPSIDAVVLTEALFAAAGIIGGLGALAALRARGRRRSSGEARHRRAEIRQLERATWRMPPLHLLTQPTMSTGRRVGLLVLRGYLVASALLVAAKVFGSFIH
ncbi:MAG: divalent metal cation transporter [Actinomycetota bacterium]|jgi:NRAMP (natural resistance-associated macrophage protein)-like metal ion transporter|nr:divalent metal cation transporter [Actinomycetota bacterium]